VWPWVAVVYQVPEGREASRLLRPGFQGASEPDHQRLRYRVWQMAHQLSSPAVKFSVKTSLSIVLVGLLSFAPASSDLFRIWRGLWALITVRESVACLKHTHTHSLTHTHVQQQRQKQDTHAHVPSRLVVD
jgi:hypothetical protein